MNSQNPMPEGFRLQPSTSPRLGATSDHPGRPAPVPHPLWVERSPFGREPGEAPLTSHFRKPPASTGTVIAAEPVHYERPGFRLPVALHRLLLVAEFIALPVFLLWWWMVYAGPVSFLVGALALFLVLRYLMPANLLSLVWMARLFNPRRSEDQVPVRYMRLRADDGREVAIRVEGQVDGANMMAGDTLAVWGSLRRGTLNLRRAVNLHTGAESRVRPTASWLPLLVNMIVLGLLIGLFAGPVMSAAAGGGR